MKDGTNSPSFINASQPITVLEPSRNTTPQRTGSDLQEERKSMRTAGESGRAIATSSVATESGAIVSVRIEEEANEGNDYMVAPFVKK